MILGLYFVRRLCSFLSFWGGDGDRKAGESGGGVFGDSRSKSRGRSTHDLVEMLVVAVCAMLCGADNFVEIELWAEARLEWLRRFMKLEHGIASHDTLGRVFGLLDAQAVERSFRQWVAGLIPALEAGTVVAVDGKTSRRSGGEGRAAASGQRLGHWHRGGAGTRGHQREIQRTHRDTAVAANAGDTRGYRHHRCHGHPCLDCQGYPGARCRLRAGGQRQPALSGRIDARVLRHRTGQ